jgi:hypothetical protein
MRAPDPAQAIRLDGNVPIEMMPSGVADATMAAVSYPMFWSPSMKATPFLEDLVLVSVVSAGILLVSLGCFTNLNMMIGES